MVKATSAVALAVLAMTASTFARPVGLSDDLIARDSEFDVEARDYNYDIEAREVEDYDVEAREVEDYDFYARELELAEEDAREFEDDYEARDYEDFEDYEARDYDDWEDMFERDPPAASTTSAPSSTITAAPTPSATTVIATKNGKPTKTIISYVQPTGCRKPGLLGRIRNAIRNRRNKKKNNKSSSSASPSSTSASGTITSSASATSTLKPTVRDRTSKGADGTRTINRTITAAQTPCPENKKRSLEIDELD